MRWTLCIGVVLLVGVAGFVSYRHIEMAQAALPQFSNIANCFPHSSLGKGSESDFDAACMQTAITGLLNHYSTAAIMNYLVASDTPPVVTYNCHEVAHVVGEDTYARSTGLEDALNECTSQCNSGCIHGALEADIAKQLGETYVSEDIVHASISTIESLGARYCDANSALCHGMGHILFIGTQDIQKSLNGCNDISTGLRSEACYQGVFMEASGEESGSGNAFVHATSSQADDQDYAYPCDAVGPQYQHACFLYLPNFQGALFAQNSVTPSAALDIKKTVCQSFKSSVRSDCFEGMGFKLDRDVDANGNPILTGTSTCAQLSGHDQNSCTIGLALRYALFEQTNNTIAMCSEIAQSGAQTLCYNVFFQTLSGSDTADQIQKACDASSEPSECQSMYTEYQKIEGTLPNYYLN